MKADFSGWATKVGLKCTDGRTIMPNAFQQQDQTRVPLVWQHGHKDSDNVLGHAILENRPEGVYAYAFFNASQKAQNAKIAVEHGDITQLSIWANNLIERAGSVLHGAIREVSLVLSGANPGAVIENVTLRHSDDGSDEDVPDEAIIYTGIELVHSDPNYVEGDEDLDLEDDVDEFEHAATADMTIQEVYDTLDEEQLQVLHYMIGVAVEDATGGSSEGEAAHADTADAGSGPTIQEIYDTLDPIQVELFNFMIGAAIEEAKTAQHSNTNQSTNTVAHTNTTQEGTIAMTNVFEKTEAASKKAVISHDSMKAIMEEAETLGSLKKAVKNYALAHSIDDIDLLFPEARLVGSTPDFVRRRTEWANSLLGGANKTPFANIKSLSADLTYDEARAAGYIKGSLKKDEFFGVSRRTTSATTVYKKQKIDRDDLIDITDFDAITWLKAEMRLMLEEEIARAILLGDGRAAESEDKIKEENVRPIAKDHELFTTRINVNIDDASSSVSEIIDAIVLNRFMYRGTGLPNFYTSETMIAKFLLLKDTTGRRIYKSLDELASELRVAAVIPVEAMESETELIGVIVNPVDYTIGSNKGGEVSMFENFDIDYNKMKYLIETRMAGALTKVKSAIAIFKVASTDVLVTPAAPLWDPETGEIVIVDTAHVVYKHGVTTITSATTIALDPDETYVVDATPASGYYFATSADDQWTYTFRG